MSVVEKKSRAKDRADGTEATKARLTLLPSAPVQLPPGVPRFLTVAEVAVMLRIRPKTVYNMVSQRRIPFRKAGHQLLFDEREIVAWTKVGADNQ